MTKAIAGVLIAAATLAGMYAVAESTSTRLAAGFVVAGPARDAPLGEFAGAVQRATAAYRMARAKCDSLTGNRKNSCRSEARAEASRAIGSDRQL